MRHVSSSGLFICVALTLLTGTGLAKDKTLKEFREYVRGKTNGRLSEAQLKTIAERVDKNADGAISDQEFAGRMAAFRAVVAGNPQPSEMAVPDVGRPSDRSEADSVAVKPFANTRDVTVLLITSEELASAWVPFARWKTQNGKLTRIVTVNEVNRAIPEDTSTQEKIRRYVRRHIEKHKTRWVILGGDCLPNGKGHVPGGHTTVHRQERKGIPTDIVYLSPTNWDADGDGIYGEFEDDRSAIQYPDGTVGLGRIPVRTRKDVQAFTEKVIAYESEYPEDTFARRMIYTCTDRPAYPKVRNSWDGHVSKVWKGEVGRFFSAETPWDKEGRPGSHDLSAANLVDLFNQKSTSKLHIHGHGHLPAWVLEKSTFGTRDSKKLRNDGAYPLITTVSCNTGEYDSATDPSIVEQMLRLPRAGSVAVVAPIRTGKPHFASRSDFRLMVTEGKLDGTTLTMTRYWALGLGENLTTGHAIMKAKSAMVSDAKASPAYHLCVCELNLLGDPTLDMRSEAPRTPKIVVKRTSPSSVAVTTDAPGSTICYWSGPDHYQVKTADTDGKTSFSGTGEGQAIVTVSGASLNSVSREISGD